MWCGVCEWVGVTTYMREKDGKDGGAGVVGMWTSRVRKGDEEVV